FTQALQQYDYAGALRIAQEWRKSEPRAIAPALAVARANIALADLSRSDKEAEGYIQQALDALEPFKTGVQASSNPASAQAPVFGADPSAVWHYHYAEALALRARLRGTAAMGLLPQIAENGEAAVKIDPSYDDFAPLRLLGMVLLKAPSWPQGPGDVE